jgi:hypothetical protein
MSKAKASGLTGSHAIELHRYAAFARITVAGALIGLATLKIMGPEHGVRAAGLGRLLATRPVSLVFAAIELTLGAALLSRFHERVRVLLTLWLSGISGLTLAFLLGGVSLEGCSCAGPIVLPRIARASVVFGLCALSFIFVRHRHSSECYVGDSSAIKPVQNNC